MIKLTEKLNSPGTYQQFFPSIAGQLEIEITIPVNARHDYVALIGHPHSLQGGTMHNKVVTTLVRMFKDLNIPSIRFNFRGVGQSSGVYDAGIGESDDMQALARQWIDEIHACKIIFAGFSFGSYVAYRAAAQIPHALLISIAPPVQHFDFTEFKDAILPWIIVQGTQDEVVATDLVLNFVSTSAPNAELIIMDTGHFFHGKLIELKEQLHIATCKQLS